MLGGNIKVMGSNIYDEKKRVINCESAEKCGSCAYAGMKYDNELKIKQGYVDKLFKDICPVDKITGMYRPVHYRNKVHAVVGEDKNGNIITGTYEENSHNIVPVSDCLLEDSQCSSIIATLRDLFKSFKYKPYNEDKGTGFIRHILLRKGFSTKEIMLVIVTADVAFPSKTHFLKALKEKHPEINTIVQNVNKYNTSMVLGPRNIVLTGKGYIEDVLCGYRFRISPSSFYQINHQQTEKLYKAAINMAGITKKDTVIDAYCGIGTIGIAASAKAGQVIGVELNADAVKDAEVNAKINNIKNIRFVNDDAGKFLPEYVSKGILAGDPFVSIDQDGVGFLMKHAVTEGRKTNPSMHFGICGEHGGEPKSIEFCHKIGLDYVSCSPYRVPIARLAAAQAAIRNSK